MEIMERLLQLSCAKIYKLGETEESLVISGISFIPLNSWYNDMHEKN